MKNVFLAIIATVPFIGMSQVTTDSISQEKVVELNEVTATAQRVVNTPDGFKLYPSIEQIESSADGYDFIKRLSLPKVVVDEAMHTIKTNELIGLVQIRINDIVASEHEILSLEMKSIKRIDVIQHPGLRYGEGVGMVVNVITKRAESGYVAGGSILESATTLFNRSNAYFKLNHGKHEFAFNYSLEVSDWNKSHSVENADYLLSDGTVYSVARIDDTNKCKTNNNTMALKYSLRDADKYNFQTSLSCSYFNLPKSLETRSEISQTDIAKVIDIENNSRSATPQLDMYFSMNMPHDQSLVANAVGSYQAEKYGYNYKSFSPYGYNVNSNVYSLVTEAIYEKRWKIITLSAGGKYDYINSNDKYIGDIVATNKLYMSQANLYSQISASIGKFALSGDIGYSGIWYKQDGREYNYHQAVPKISITYSPCNKISLNYSSQLRNLAPRLSLINDIVTKQNDMEYVIGNPDIKPHKRYEQELSVNFSVWRTQSNLSVMYRMNHNTWMDDIMRVDDNKFYYTKKNKGDINMLYISDNTSIQIIPNKLILSLEGSFIRCFNYADTYTHCYSTWLGGIDLQSYFGKFSITAHADNGWKCMEGERKIYNGGSTYLTAGYKLGRWGNITIMWQNVFDKQYVQQRSWLINDVVRKINTSYAANLGNMVSFRLSINISRGRKYQGIQRSLDNSAVESTTVKAKE